MKSSTKPRHSICQLLLANLMLHLGSRLTMSRMKLLLLRRRTTVVSLTWSFYGGVLLLMGLSQPWQPLRHVHGTSISVRTDSLIKSVVLFTDRIAAFLLPFGSGSAPAAKGVITQMCPDSQRADALNAVTLVENVARLATQGLFGFIFASLAEAGKAYATFFCNAVCSPSHNAPSPAETDRYRPSP